MVVHAPGNLLLVVALHLARLLLNLLHLLAALELLFLHFTDQVFLLLFVAGHKGGLFLLTVTFFGLDRFDQVADLLLQLVSLLLLDEDLSRHHVWQLAFVTLVPRVLVDDLEDS